MRWRGFDWFVDEILNMKGRSDERPFSFVGKLKETSESWIRISILEMRHSIDRAHTRTMPIFARRRLRAMLEDLSGHLDGEKEKDLTHRLENKSTSTAIAAEAELAVLWAISRVAQLTIEPKLIETSNRPDASSSNLFPWSSAIIEVRAISDDSFSGKEAMNRTANIISAYADRLRKGAGSRLYFEFSEYSYWENHRFHRKRCIDPEFTLTTETKEAIRNWILITDKSSQSNILIEQGQTKVSIQWKNRVSRYSRTFCKMPAVAYDLEDNPIYKALKSKSKQLKEVNKDKLRCVFLFDAGCSMLRNQGTSYIGREIGANKIINHAINKLSIDLVCVLSPHRNHNFLVPAHEKLYWQANYFDRRSTWHNTDYDRSRKMLSHLPRPNFEGYQARSLHEQGEFHPQLGKHYLGTHITTSGIGPMTIKISSRLVQDYFAGRVSVSQFQHFAFNGDQNLFEKALSNGRTIRNVRLEEMGIDTDDDLLAFELENDWGATFLNFKTEKEPDAS